MAKKRESKPAAAETQEAASAQNALSSVRAQIAKRIAACAPAQDVPFPDNWQSFWFARAANENVLRELDDAITEYSRKYCCKVAGQKFGMSGDAPAGEAKA